MQGTPQEGPESGDDFLEALRSAAKERDIAMEEARASAKGGDQDSERLRKARLGYLATMGQSKESKLPARPSRPSDRESTVETRNPTGFPTQAGWVSLLTAAAVLFVSGVGVYRLARGADPEPSSLQPNTSEPATDVRMGTEQFSGSAVKVVSRDEASLTLDLGHGTIQDGWYEGIVRLADGGTIIARTDEWHVDAEWKIGVPRDTPMPADSVWVEVKVRGDDGTQEGIERTSWEGRVLLED